MIQSADGFVHADNNPDYSLAIEAAHDYTVDQIDDFARQAGFGDFINGSGRIALRYVGRESAKLLLQEMPPQTVERARLESGFDGPVVTTLKGWSLAVATEPFVKDELTFDTGVRIIAGMRKNWSRRLVRLPLDLAVALWPASGTGFIEVGERQFDAPDTFRGDRGDELLQVANKFIGLLANS